RVTLIATEDDAVVGAERPALPRRGKDDGPGLAGEGFACARHVRHAGQLRPRGELHAVEDHPGKRVGQEVPQPHVAPPLLGELVARIEAARRARLGDQLVERYLQRLSSAIPCSSSAGRGARPVRRSGVIGRPRSCAGTAGTANSTSMLPPPLPFRLPTPPTPATSAISTALRRAARRAPRGR